MEFSRAVLVACATVLGFMLYVVAGLLLTLALVNLWRGAAANAPAPETLVLAAGFAIVGYALRIMARKFS